VLEALDWETGKEKFYKNIGTHSNPLYSGTEIGSHKDVMIGTVFGPVRIKDVQSDL